MKIDRKAVYEKYNGHCAYCGREIGIKDMQVDHMIPQRYGEVMNFDKFFPAPETRTEAERKALSVVQETRDIDCTENLMPSCRVCNHYKRAESLETFRKWIRTIPCKLGEREYIYKVGMAYGFYDDRPRDVIFYFEREEQDEKENS